MSETTELNQHTPRDTMPMSESANGDGYSPDQISQEEIIAREKARRYRLRFVDLKGLDADQLDYHLIHELPVDLMVRHSFVPLRRDGDTLYVAMADPTNFDVMDEIEGQL